MDRVIGDLIIVYEDGTEERLADAEIESKGEWIHVAGRYDSKQEWHQSRYIQSSRIKEVRRWDRFGWYDSYDRIMALSDEQILNLTFGPIRMAKPAEEEK